MAMTDDAEAGVDALNRAIGRTSARYPYGVSTGRGPGRPRVAEPRSWVSTKLPASAHDRLCQIAAERETSVSALVRQILIVNIPRE